jgi:ABC-type multidrug transport system fused ATPase/permease subunit
LNRPITKLKSSTLIHSFRVLAPIDRKKVVFAGIIQSLLGLLDLLGVMAVGLLGALSVTGLQSQDPGNRASLALRILHISELSFQVQATLLGLFAVLVLAGRTLLSIFFTRRILFFMSRRGASISSDIISKLLAQNLLKVQAKTSQETLFAVTTGVEIIVLQVIATAVILFADLSLLVIMAIGLLLVDPTTAVGTFCIFFLIAYVLNKFMNVRAKKLGVRNSELGIRSNEKILEVFSSYRESFVRNRREFYSREIGKQRLELADIRAEINFLPFISKYVIESAVIIGALVISAVQLLLQDSSHAIATLAIFLAAGSRIAPAVLRAQQGSIQIRNGLGQAVPTLELLESLHGSVTIENANDSVDDVHRGFVAEIVAKGINFSYPGKSVKAVRDFSIRIPAGTFVAFVGPSGAGKTTIIDILLGVLTPDEGEIEISGLSPSQAFAMWPGAVSYVPQDVIIASGTIRENVAFGYPALAATDELISDALKVAHLEKFVSTLPLGSDTPVGERGAKISGGQRQRLGIARAMFTKPSLLVLDEATSSLDGETEAGISDAIQALRGTTTVVMIAHRLSTVRNADLVVYLEDGNVLAVGSFKQVRNSIPDFDRQAKLMGL